MKSPPAVAKETGLSPRRLRANFANGLWPATQTPGGQLRYTDEQIEFILSVAKQTPRNKTRPLEWYLEKGHVRYIGGEALAELISRTPKCTGSNIERLFWLQHNLTDYPTCQACGKSLTSKQWLPSKANYRKFCGRSCAYLHGTKKENYKSTCLERYGVEHPMQTPEVISKIKQANILKYGLPNPMKWSGEKFASIIQQKYGVATVRHVPHVHDSIVAAISRKTTEYLPVRIASLEKIFEVECLTDLSALGTVQRVYDIDFSWKHKCGHVYSCGLSVRGIRRCPSCFTGGSQGEQAVADFVQSLGFEIVQRTRNIISPSEIDIWIPSKNIGIEFDGTYWHSAKFEDKKRSIRKVEACDKIGVRLITLQEHLWLGKPELVKTRLKSILGLNRLKVPARKTQVREIEPLVAKKFLEEHHLQGSAKATVFLGLFFNEELLSVATFSKPRWSKKHDWELIRMATKGETTVQGGASKLLCHFRKNHPGSIISYADRCWSTGNVYKQAGFRFSHYTAPSYWWVHNYLGTYARYQTQKKKLGRLLGDLKKTFYPELSEEDNMRLAGFLPLYDRGNSVWVIDD